MPSTAPFIAISPWRRELPTFVHPKTDLYTLAPYYTDAVERAGGQSAILPAVADQESANILIERFDGLILSGGSDLDPALYSQVNQASYRPDRSTDESDGRLLMAALEQGKPVLGICRGAQVINVTLGGSLHQQIWGTSTVHPEREASEDPIADADRFLANRHSVELTSGSTLAKILGCNATDTNSLHHQSVDRLAAGLRIVGTAADGIIEALEHETHPLVAVLWHPERLPHHQPLFDWLVDRAQVTGAGQLRS